MSQPRPLPHVVRTWVFSREGVVASSDPEFRGHPTFDADLTDRALSGEKAVSRVIGTGIDKTTFAIAVPIPGSSPAFGLAAEIRAGFLGNTLFEKSGMGPGWVTAIVDPDKTSWREALSRKSGWERRRVLN